MHEEIREEMKRGRRLNMVQRVIAGQIN